MPERLLDKEGSRRRLAISIKNDSWPALLQFKDAIDLLFVAWRPDDANIAHNAGAPNENIVQNHLNITLLNVF